ncbi:MAG TPA: hypothetical protein VMZ31_08335 [Phycisphaerae bacterium]|nr:hypothetical protein [Phycisphaerae bacterium]
MDASALARDMLKWEQKRRELDELEAAIRDTVLQLGKTQTVGNVRASYSAGRKAYDYQAAVEATNPLPVVLETFQTVKTDWRYACKIMEIDDIPFTQDDPTVSIKLL